MIIMMPATVAQTKIRATIPITVSVPFMNHRRNLIKRSEHHRNYDVCFFSFDSAFLTEKHRNRGDVRVGSVNSDGRGWRRRKSVENERNADDFGNSKSKQITMQQEETLNSFRNRMFRSGMGGYSGG